jgi:D-alanyl-D-alanine carboxypeptidase
MRPGRERSGGWINASRRIFSGTPAFAPADRLAFGGAGAVSFDPVPTLHRIAVVAALAVLSAGAVGRVEARASRTHSIHEPSYRPLYADIVVDDNSGQVLHDVNADEPRHPASLTKIMTLYLLFEQLDAGALKLDTPLPISAKAALEPPTRLGLKAGQAITVEDAIGGIVTRSANDAAVVVSEAVGGSEEEFAKLMTRKARALGMTSTTYVNASGLPDDEQITTARDQAILGRAIHDRFPSHYSYFSMLYFRYHGKDLHNHNGLLGKLEGVDGIKTGYTEASGYNLALSVRRARKCVVAVVLGGTSNSERDARMRKLIEDYIPQASAQRTAPLTVESAGPHEADADTAASTKVSAPKIAPGAGGVESNFEE